MTKLQYQILRNRKRLFFRDMPKAEQKMFAALGIGLVFEAACNQSNHWVNVGRREHNPYDTETSMFAVELKYRIVAEHRPKTYPKELDTE